MDERQLVRGCAGGSEDAFRELVRSYTDMVYSVCYRELKDPHLAEDAVQAVFIVFAQRVSHLPAQTLLSGWLFKTARLTSANMLRSRSRQLRHEQEAVRILPASENPPEWKTAAMALLNEALDWLNERDRDAVILKHLQNKTFKEVGQALGISEDAAEKRVSRALEKLQGFFGVRGIVVSCPALAVTLASSLNNAPAHLAESSITAVLAGTRGGVGGTTAVSKSTTQISLKAGVFGLSVALFLGVLGVFSWRHSTASPSPAPFTRAQEAQNDSADRVEAAGLIRRFIDSDSPHAVAVFSDGSTAISGGAGSLRLWNIQTGRELRSFDPHHDLVTAVAISPDGRYVLSGSMATVQLWDVKTGRVVREFEGHKGQVTSVAFSPDGSHALSSADTSIILWDVSNGKELLRLKGHADSVNAVAWCSDGKRCVSASADHTVRLWDTAAGVELHRFTGHADKVLCIAVSPDGHYALSGSADGTARLWDLNAGLEGASSIKAERIFDGNKMAVQSVAITSDSRYVATGSGGAIVSASGPQEAPIGGIKDCDIRLFDFTTGRESTALKGHTMPLTCLAFYAGGGKLISAGDDLRTWVVSK